MSLLEQRLTRKGYAYRVVNASVSGETTAGGRARLTHALDLHHPSIVILELGGNDGLRGLRIRQIRENLAAMLTQLASAHARVLLLGIRIPPNYGPEYAESLHALYEQLAQREHVALVDFFLEGVASDPSAMQEDGLHPNEKAQPRLLENVWPALQALLSH